MTPKTVDPPQYLAWEYYSKIWNYLKWLRENKNFIVQQIPEKDQFRFERKYDDYIRHAEGVILRMDTFLEIEFIGDISSLKTLTHGNINHVIRTCLKGLES